MSNPRDRIDDWLNTEVEPLPPPSGTFERVRLRARRRKISRVVMSAAATRLATSTFCRSSQLCGMGHYRMQANLRVLPPAEFDAWLAAKIAARIAAHEKAAAQ